MGPGLYKEPTLLWCSLVGCAGAFLLVLLLLGPSAASAFFTCSLSALFPVTWMLARQQACQEVKRLRDETGRLRVRTLELENATRHLAAEIVERDRRGDAAFTGGVTPAAVYWNGKIYTQNYRWSVDYVK